MKIIKHGKKFDKKTENKFEDFKCESCGCEFSVKEDEYYIDYGGKDAEAEESLTSITISAYINDYYVCSCPECHKIVKKVSSRTRINYLDMISGSSVTYDNPEIPRTLC